MSGGGVEPGRFCSIMVTTHTPAASASSGTFSQAKKTNGCRTRAGVEPGVPAAPKPGTGESARPTLSNGQMSSSRSTNGSRTVVKLLISAHVKNRTVRRKCFVWSFGLAASDSTQIA